jgi:hypothetical protein
MLLLSIETFQIIELLFIVLRFMFKNRRMDYAFDSHIADNRPGHCVLCGRAKYRRRLPAAGLVGRCHPLVRFIGQ